MKFFSIIFRSQMIILTATLIQLFFSCRPTKTVSYFQNKSSSDTTTHFTLANLTPVAAIIEQDDILAIVVSSLSEESNNVINYLNKNTLTVTAFPGMFSTGNQPLGYLVDAMGEVNIPLAGKVKLSGLTLEQANKFLENKLSTFLTNPSVNIRQLNAKFTVIGEVTRPGVYNLTNNRTTLPDVIGMAGDLTIYGRRDNLMLLRTINNKRELYKIDLTTMKVLDSPFYFIQKDDVIYVEPRPGKITSTTRGVQLLPLFLGITSTLLILISLLK